MYSPVTYPQFHHSKCLGPSQLPLQFLPHMAPFDYPLLNLSCVKIGYGLLVQHSTVFQLIIILGLPNPSEVLLSAWLRLFVSSWCIYCIMASYNDPASLITALEQTGAYVASKSCKSSVA